MTNPLISTAACATADTMARELAGMGARARLISVERKRFTDNDLVYWVQARDGKAKEVIVTARSLKDRLKAERVDKI